MKGPINTSLIVKLNFLILGLGLVVYFMYALNTQGLPAPIAAVFGGGYGQINWCDTRVQAIILPDRFKLEQVDRNWLVEDASGTKRANFLEVEKWFVEYCRIKGEPAAVPVGPEFRAAMVVKFIDGQIEVLKQGPESLISWRGQVLAAPAMAQALADLTKLAADENTSPAPEMPEESEP